MTLDLESALADHGPFLHRLALGLVRDDHEAQDVVQDVLAAAIARPSVGLVSSPRAWLARAVRNRAINVLRRRRSQALPTVDPETPTDFNPGSIALRLERERILHGELESLDEPYRSTLVLRYRDGMSTREIARTVGAREAAVESRLHRGRALLRARLERKFPSDDMGDPRSGWLAALTPVFTPTGTAARRTGETATSSSLSLVWLGSCATAVLAVTGMWAAMGGLRGAPATHSPSISRDVPALETESIASLARHEEPRKALSLEPAPSPVAEDEPGAFEYKLGGFDGRPFPGMLVELRRAEVGRSTGPVVRQRTDEQGRVLFEGLAPGRYEVRACNVPHWNAFEVAAGETQSLSSRSGAEPLDLEGQVVRPDGSPVSGATVWVTRNDGRVSSALPYTQTDRLGRFEVREAHGVGVQATAAGLVPSNRIYVSSLEEVEPGVRSVVLRVGGKGATVSGVVRAPDGARLANATVVAGSRSRVGFPAEGWLTPAPTFAVTDEAGEFVIEHAELPGTLGIDVFASGYATRSLELAISSARSSVEVTLAAPGSVRGLVLGSSGKPMANVEVRAIESTRDLGEVPLVNEPSALSGPDGRFEITGLAPGDVELRASAWVSDFGAEAHASATATVEPGGSREVQLQLETSTLLAGQVVDPSGEAVPRALLRVRDARTGHTIAMASADEDGVFLMTLGTEDGPVDPDLKLNVTVSQSIKVSTRTVFQEPIAAFEAVPSGSKELRFEVPAPATPLAHVSGKLAHDAGRIPAHWTLRMRRANASWGPEIAFEAGTGSFSVGPILAREYVIEVYDGQERLAARSGIVAVDGEPLDLGAILVGAGGHVEVEVAKERAGSMEDPVRVQLEGRGRVMVDLTQENGLWSTPRPIEPGRWTLRASSRHWKADPVEVQVRHGETTHASIP